MDCPPFCPNPLCHYHLHAPPFPWFLRTGYYSTRLFGLVPRFKCVLCGRRFSPQTFSIDYCVKKLVDYRELLTRHASSECVRAIGRAMNLSCGSVLNRFDRLARQGAALHARLRPLASPAEAVCADGFVSFDVSQFFPSELTLSITSASRFALDLSHATRKRSGSMTQAQKAHATALYACVPFERGGVARTFRDILSSLEVDRPPTPRHPLVLITDEKPDYRSVLHRSRLWRTQDEEHRVAHIQVNSRLPRTFANPLFPSNYLDREIRKDQAAHHRESTCFNRNVANGMSRLLCYLVQHNYRKRFLIKAPVGEDAVHAQMAGIGKELLERRLEAMFTKRAFLTRMYLPATLERIWRKAFMTPLKTKAEYLPAFALG